MKLMMKMQGHNCDFKRKHDFSNAWGTCTTTSEASPVTFPKYVRMHACMYVCTYVCMYVGRYVCMYMYVCTYACMHVCMYVCVCVCMYVRMCVCT